MSYTWVSTFIIDRVCLTINQKQSHYHEIIKIISILSRYPINDTSLFAQAENIPFKYSILTVKNIRIQNV